MEAEPRDHGPGAAGAHHRAHRGAPGQGPGGQRAHRGPRRPRDPAPRPPRRRRHRPHPLQHREPRHGRLRHRARHRAGAARAGPPAAGAVHRDPALQPGRAPDGAGAAPRAHPRHAHRRQRRRRRHEGVRRGRWRWPRGTTASPSTWRRRAPAATPRCPTAPASPSRSGRAGSSPTWGGCAWRRPVSTCGTLRLTSRRMTSSRAASSPSGGCCPLATCSGSWRTAPLGGSKAPRCISLCLAPCLSVSRRALRGREPGSGGSMAQGRPKAAAKRPRRAAAAGTGPRGPRKGGRAIAPKKLHVIRQQKLRKRLEVGIRARIERDARQRAGAAPPPAPQRPAPTKGKKGRG
ncbi:methylthioribose-1-phosphate isomerase isoform 2-T2 [Amazona ochrocephala]